MTTCTCGPYTYTLLPGGSASIVDYAPSDGKEQLIIPAELDDHPVTAISEWAFCGADFVSITLPGTLTTISAYAFLDCRQLRSVTLPSGLTTLGDSAFAFCSVLTSVTLPESLVTIGANPFTECLRLTEMVVRPDHPRLALVDGVLFDKVSHTLIFYPPSRPGTTYTVPQDTLAIGGNAFHGCDELEEIRLPEGLVSIGSGAFHSCISLRAIKLPMSLHTIGNNPFCCCDQLKELNVPAGHAVLSRVDDMLIDRGEQRLICQLIASESPVVTVPEGIRTIGVQAFDHCRKVTRITLPESVVVLGRRAFAWCRRLTDVRLPTAIASVASGTFYACQSLESIVLPEGLTTVSERMFDRCRELKRVTLPASIAAIGENAFTGCCDLVITAPADSFAAQYCQHNGIPCESSDSSC